jgi:hypothetical protein
MESGNFLQPNALAAGHTCSSHPAECGDVSGDNLTMQATVIDDRNTVITTDDTTIFPATAVLRTAVAAATTSDPYSFNLSPTTSIFTSAAGATTLTYTWVYNYTNTSQPVTSKFSDPAGGIGNCEVPSQNPGCQSVVGGVGVYGIPFGDPDGVLPILFATTGAPVPEPSSVLLLGLGLLSGGLFFASRLRKEKERETR